MRSEWSITWDEYKELVYFCRQYARKRAEAESLLTLRISTPQPVTASDGSAEFLPHGSGGTSDPVAMIAEKRERLLADCQMIEYIIKGCQIGLAAFIGTAVFVGAWLLFAVLIAMIGMAVDKLKGDEQ